MASYWSRLVRSRISRRRALAITGAGAFSAAFLAACGSDDDAGTPASTAGGASTPPSGATAATGSTGPGDQ